MVLSLNMKYLFRFLMVLVLVYPFNHIHLS
jgi:hypothetical protein